MKFYLQSTGYNIKTTETASNIVNKLINAKDLDNLYIKSVQQIPNKQESNIYKVILQPKFKISFQNDNIRHYPVDNKG